MEARLLVLLAVVALSMSAPQEAPAALVSLGSADGFAVLGGSGISVAGAVNSTTITGDIGTFPTPSITGLSNVVLNGVNHGGDAVTQSAKTDLVTAYNDAAGRVYDVLYGGAHDLGGSTLTSGVYHGDSSLFLTGTMTLDALGNPDAVWIFQVGSTLITAANSSVVLTGGALAGHVFWQVGSSVTLGTHTDFVGSMLALSSITLTTGAALDGRALALNGAVALDANTITVIPEPSAALGLLAGVSCLVLGIQRFTARRLLFPPRAPALPPVRGRWGLTRSA